MLLETTKLSNNGVLRTPAVREILSDDKTDIKSKIRIRVEREVGDKEDHIADNAKMISLLLSVISILWNGKENATEEQLEFVEYGLDKFKDTLTLADIKFASDGTKEIDKLLDRQGKIGFIVRKELKI